MKGKHHNVSMLINRKGEIKGTYKKIHLYDEDNVIPGKKIGVFNTDFAKIGIVLCWDLKFSRLFKKMKQKGAEIVFCPAQWCYEEKAHDKDHKLREKQLLESLIRARAFENIYFVALCNPVIPKEDDLISYSAIASPHKLLNQITDKEGIITAEINLKEIKKLGKIYNRFNP
jgi:predicted amidohydrolase